MYDKNGKSYMANTMEDHLRMKKKGYSHMGAFGKKKRKRKRLKLNQILLQICLLLNFKHLS